MARKKTTEPGAVAAKPRSATVIGGATAIETDGREKVTVGWTQKIEGRDTFIAPGTILQHSPELADGEWSYSGQVAYYGGAPRTR